VAWWVIDRVGGVGRCNSGTGTGWHFRRLFPGVLKFLNIIEREKRCDTLPTGAIVSFSLFTPHTR
jgi:hypothetical protein